MIGTIRAAAMIRKSSVASGEAAECTVIWGGTSVG